MREIGRGKGPQNLRVEFASNGLHAAHQCPVGLVRSLHAGHWVVKVGLLAMLFSFHKQAGLTGRKAWRDAWYNVRWPTLASFPFKERISCRVECVSPNLINWVDGIRMLYT